MEVSSETVNEKISAFSKLKSLIFSIIHTKKINNFLNMDNDTKGAGINIQEDGIIYMDLPKDTNILNISDISENIEQDVTVQSNINIEITRSVGNQVNEDSIRELDLKLRSELKSVQKYLEEMYEEDKCLRNLKVETTIDTEGVCTNCNKSVKNGKRTGCSLLLISSAFLILTSSILAVIEVFNLSNISNTNYYNVYTLDKTELDKTGEVHYTLDPR